MADDQVKSQRTHIAVGGHVASGLDDVYYGAGGTAARWRSLPTPWVPRYVPASGNSGPLLRTGSCGTRTPADRSGSLARRGGGETLA
jgi:hypothetical protein